LPLGWGAPVPPPALSGSGSTGSQRIHVSQADAAPQDGVKYTPPFWAGRYFAALPGLGTTDFRDASSIREIKLSGIIRSTQRAGDSTERPGCIETVAMGLTRVPVGVDSS